MLTDGALCNSVDQGALRSADPNGPLYDQIASVSRLVFLGLIALSNVVMWGLFTWSLSLAPSSALATVVNSAANLLFTVCREFRLTSLLFSVDKQAILGHLVFAEPLSLQWYLGASLLLVGVLVLQRGLTPRSDSSAAAGDKKTR